MLRREIEQVVGEYLFDCTNFRTDDKDDLLRQVYEMTDRRFGLAAPPAADEAVGALRDGRDGRRPHAPRLLEGHGRRAPQARPDTAAHRDAILDYHRHVDALVGGLRRGHADDDTTVLVVSDHGAKRMDGGIRINEWLRREGLLHTLREPEPDRRRRSPSSASTGRGRSRGARAATTGASS